MHLRMSRRVQRHSTEMPRINEVYAFISEDTGPDDEGIIGAVFGGQWMPFVCGDKARVDSLRPHAEKIAELTGKKVKLVKFAVRTDVETIG